MVLQDHVTNWSHYNSTTRVAVATDAKVKRMVSHLDRISPIKSHNPLIAWFWKITWQTKAIVSPLPQCLLPSYLERWWLYFRAPNHHITLQSSGLTNSHDKQKSLYLHYQGVYGHQNWQDDSITWRAPKP